MMGKGLELSVIMELLLYASANLVNICLPLAVLLSSIMTFGNLAENFELVALKSAGISLIRIMSPLIVFVCFITLGAFYFANNIAPVATLKFKSLLYDITQAKPGIELKDGIFYNGIEGYSIRVGHNNRETGKLSDMLIYDHSKASKGNKTVIRAKEGRMEQTNDKRFLILTLKDGYAYDESNSSDNQDSNFPLMRNHFEKDVLRIDVSGFMLQRSDEDQWKNHMQMLTMGQIDESIDSLKSLFAKRIVDYDKYLNRTTRIRTDTVQETSDVVPLPYFSDLNTSRKRQTVVVAKNIAQNNLNYVIGAKKEFAARSSYITKHHNEWHRKLTLPAACLVFFFIGAPLGALIKKGGIGLPVVVSVLFFLLFHITSITGEKMAKTGVMDSFSGMWLSTFILLPISVFLTLRASKDAALFVPGGFDRIFSRFRPRKKKEK